MDAAEIRSLQLRLRKFLKQFDDCFARRDTRPIAQWTRTDTAVKKQPVAALNNHRRHSQLFLRDDALAQQWM